MKRFLLLTLISSSSLIAQKSVYIEYASRIQPIQGLFKDHQQLRSAFQYATENDDRLLFGLIIQNEEAKFYDLSAMSSNEFSQFDRMVLNFSGFTGIIYSLSDEIFTEYPFLGANVYKKSKKTEGWILTNETKIIDTFLCFKATNTSTIINGEKVFKHPIIAWYCPKYHAVLDLTDLAICLD